MKKLDLSVTRENECDVIRYELLGNEKYDERIADKVTQLSNILPFQFSNQDGKRVITTYVRENFSLEMLFSKALQKREVLCLLGELVSVFDIGTQGIPVSYVVKDFNNIYVNQETLRVKCILVPVKQEAIALSDIPDFFRNVISRMSFDEIDTDNYVAKLLTVINTKDFSTIKLKNYIDDELEKMGLFISKDKGLTSVDAGGNIVQTKSVKVNKLGVINNMQNSQPPMGMPPQGMMPQGRPPMGMPPQGMMPQGQPPMGMPPQGMMPQGRPPMGMPPQGVPPMMGQAPKPQGPQGMPQPNAPVTPKTEGVPPMMGQAPKPQGVPPMMGQMPPKTEGVPPMMGQAPKPNAPVPPMMGQTPKPNAPVPPMMGQAPKPQGMPPMMGQMPPKTEGVPPMMGQAPKPQGVPPMMGQAPKPQGVPPMMGQMPPQVQPEQKKEEIPMPMSVANQMQEEKPAAEEKSVQEEKPVVEEKPVQEEKNVVDDKIKFEDIKPVTGSDNNSNNTDSLVGVETPKTEIPVPNGPGIMMRGLSGQISSRPVPHFVRVKTGEIINITKPEFTIGKSESKADYTIKDNTAVSRVHCIIVQKDGVNYIKDNNSTNHTYLNGVELEPGKEVLLKNKTTVRMGDEEFTFLLRKE